MENSVLFTWLSKKRGKVRVREVLASGVAGLATAAQAAQALDALVASGLVTRLTSKNASGRRVVFYQIRYLDEKQYRAWLARRRWEAASRGKNS